MTKPRFPNVPYGTDWIRMISPAWFQELKTFCEWAADHPRGDGNTIFNTGDGMLRAKARGGGGGEGGVTFPCFQVSADDTGRLKVSSGWLNRNGEMLLVKSAEGIAPKTGYLCLCTEPDSRGQWSEPEFKITEPAPAAYPVAEIKVENSSVSIVQYPVAVAMILLVKQCPIAEF